MEQSRKLPQENNTASIVLNDEREHWIATREKLLEQRHEQLAHVAEELTKLDTYDDTREILPSKLTARLEWYRHEIDKYNDGYAPDPLYRAATYEIICTDLVAAWLGLLARQPKPLRQLEQQGRDSRVLTVRVSAIAIGDNEFIPRESFGRAFSFARLEALNMIPHFLTQATESSRYSEIPTTIEPDKIADMEARVLMIQYCQARDSNFSLSAV